MSEQDRPAAATTAAGWKRDKPTLVQLPSGNSALLVKPQILRMVKSGQIPNPLAAAAIQLADGEIDGDEVSVGVEVVDILVAASFVEPTVCTGDPDDCPEGSLHIDELDDQDKGFVLGRALGRVLELAPFPGDGPGAESGGDGGDVRDEAEQPAGAD